jgi:hypothetical protein
MEWWSIGVLEIQHSIAPCAKSQIMVMGSIILFPIKAR